jgi:acetyltransferase-like isoleucine patch superfamily enzyme
MPRFIYRELEPPPDVKAYFTQWLQQLDQKFTQHTSYEKRSEVVRDELHRLFTPHVSSSSLGLEDAGDSLLGLSFDARHITLEPEYYGDIDVRRYNERKPLIYLWQMFDRSPLGLNHWLGFRLRTMLGKHIFKHLGDNVKIFHNVEFSFGYNLVIEEDCTIHKNVLLDDRGGIILRRGSSVSDYANIYSHTHDIHDQSDVTNKVTEIGPFARITYHATVLAGSRIGEDAMLGAMGIATRNVAPHVVSVGIPAKAVRLKERGQQSTASSAADFPATKSPAAELPRKRLVEEGDERLKTSSYAGIGGNIQSGNRPSAS